jgi:hypothetical protein
MRCLSKGAYAWVLGAILCVMLFTFRTSASGFPDGQSAPVRADSGVPVRHAAKPKPRYTVQRLAAAERFRAAMVMIVRPDGSQGGSGFVISTKHRLVATAAHVAEFALGRGLAVVREGTQTAIRVTRVWFHPGLHRKLDRGLVVRSDDPRDGKISFRGPDVAVMQLSDSSTGLPLELDLANDDDLRAMDGQVAGMFGYPGYAEGEMPPHVRPARAAFCSVTVGRSADDLGNPDFPFKQRQWIWFDGGLGDGASGAPLFLMNGRAVAIYTHGTLTVCDENPYWDCGFRIDCLRELLTYHKLNDLAQGPLENEKPNPEWGPDPHLLDYRRAVGLVRSAQELRRASNYRDAVQQCEEAMALAPGYGGAFLERSKAYLFFLGSRWAELSSNERDLYSLWAWRDSYHALDICPEWNYARMIHTQNVIFRAHALSQAPVLKLLIGDMDEMLREDWCHGPLSSGERSFALNCRALCHALLGQSKEAENDYSESIRLAPTVAQWYTNRADFWSKNGRADLAGDDRLAAALMKKVHPRPDLKDTD